MTKWVQERLILGFGCVRSWFTPTWVNRCIYVRDGETERFVHRGVHLQIQSREACVTCTEHRRSPTTFPCTLMLLSTTAPLPAGFPTSAFLHRQHSECFFCITSSFVIITDILMGLEIHPLPTSVCNFKMIVFDVMTKCQAALGENAESSAQQKTSNKKQQQRILQNQRASEYIYPTGSANFRWIWGAAPFSPSSNWKNKSDRMRVL